MLIWLCSCLCIWLFLTHPDPHPYRSDHLFFLFLFFLGGLSFQNFSAPLRKPEAPQCPPTAKFLATPLQVHKANVNHINLLSWNLKQPIEIFCINCTNSNTVVSDLVVRIGQKTDTSLEVLWSAPSFSVDNYRISYDDFTATVTSSSQTYTLTGLSSGTPYTVLVEALIGDSVVDSDDETGTTCKYIF